MANDITGNPWTLDTVSATVPVWKGMIFIEHVEFIDYTADGDTCQLKDSAGRVVWEGNGAADLEPIRSGKIGRVNGLFLTVLSQALSRVRVYIR